MRAALITTALITGLMMPALALAQTPGSEAQSETGGMAMMHEGHGESGPMALMEGQRGEMMIHAMRELGSGAFFRFRRGDDEVDVHCPPKVNLQSCVGAATTLMSSLQDNASVESQEPQAQEPTEQQPTPPTPPTAGGQHSGG